MLSVRTFFQAAAFAALLMANGCPGRNSNAPAATASSATEAHEDEAIHDALLRRTVVVVLGSSESEPWTAALLGALGAQLNIDPTQEGKTETGLDTFGPFDCKLGNQPLRVHLALCDLSSVADVATQAKLGDLAKAWIEKLKPDAVWLDGDQLQLQCGSKLEPDIPLVFTGVEVRSDAFYAEGRAVCGMMRQHSLARTMGELFKLAPDAKQVALVSDDSPPALSRIAEVRNLERAMPFGVTFVTQPPVRSWPELEKLFHEMDSGLDAVVVCGMGEAGGGIAKGGKAAPAGILKGFNPPVLTYGPTALDNSGVLSLRLKPSAHARYALERIGQILDGKPAATLGVTIPDEMDLYRSER